MRLFVQIMNVIMGLTPEKSAENIYKVIYEIVAKGKLNATYAYSKERKSIKLELKAGDENRLLELIDDLLAKWK